MDNIEILDLNGSKYSISDANAIKDSEKGANGGVASLDNNGKIPISQIPFSVIDKDVVVAKTNNETTVSSSSTGNVKTYTVGLATDIKNKVSTAYNHSQTQGNPHNTTIGDINGLQTELTSIESEIDAIEAVIPDGATSTNQLADKAFVNSSITTNTATFRGTSAKNLTEAQFLAWANTLTKTKNDYCFWNTVDSDGNVVFKRYKYDGSNWIYEYSLNNSSFTASQWASINSGIVSGDVSDLHTHLTDNTRHITAAERTTWNGKASQTALDNEIAARTNKDASQDTRINGIEDDLDDHIADGVKHITSAERNSWNSKQAALSTAQLSAISSVSGHINDNIKHITSTERTNWNAKATSTDITNAINALDVSDSAVANQFVTKVSETDGKISVSRAQPTIADVSGLQTALNGKQAVISDLSTIRTNAANGQTAYSWGNHAGVGYLKSADISGKEDKTNKVITWSSTTSDTKYPSEKLVKTALDNKVDKVTGKGLSTNDYTTTEKTKLSGIAAGAEVNVQSDWSVTDSASDAFIKNKPTIPASVTIVQTTGTSSAVVMSQKAITDISGTLKGNIDCVSQAMSEMGATLGTQIGTNAGNISRLDATKQDASAMSGYVQFSVPNNSIAWAGGSATNGSIAWYSGSAKDSSIAWAEGNASSYSIASNATANDNSIAWAGGNASVTSIAWAGSNATNCSIAWANSDTQEYSIGWNNGNASSNSVAWDYASAVNYSVAWNSSTAKDNSVAWNSSTAKDNSVAWQGGNSNEYSVAWAGGNASGRSIAWNGATADGASIAWAGGNALGNSLACGGGKASNYSIAWSDNTSANECSVAWAGASASINSLAFNGGYAIGGSISTGANSSATLNSLGLGKDTQAYDESIALGAGSVATNGSIALKGGHAILSSVAIGVGIRTSAPSNFAIGQYNKEEAHLFAIGNGNDATDRSNALTVDWNGDVSAANFYGLASTANMVRDYGNTAESIYLGYGGTAITKVTPNGGNTSADTCHIIAGFRDSNNITHYKDVNVNSVTVNSALNATKATQDGSGNTITSTYAKTSHTHNASAINAGTLAVARGGTGQTSVANIQAGKDGSGNVITSTYLPLGGKTYGSSTMRGTILIPWNGTATSSISNIVSTLSTAYNNTVYVILNTNGSTRKITGFAGSDTTWDLVAGTCMYCVRYGGSYYRDDN